MTCRVLRVLALAAGVSFAGLGSSSIQAQKPLGPTAHPTLPRNESDLWLVPAATDRSARVTASAQSLAATVRRYRDGEVAFEGDQRVLMAYLQYVKLVLAAPRKA